LNLIYTEFVTSSANLQVTSFKAGKETLLFLPDKLFITYPPQKIQKRHALKDLQHVFFILPFKITYIYSCFNFLTISASSPVIFITKSISAPFSNADFATSIFPCSIPFSIPFSIPLFSAFFCNSSIVFAKL